MPETLSHSFQARTGSVSSWAPRGMPTVRPAPSGSVLLRLIVSVRPSGPSVTSATSRPTSSLRRSAPAKPSRSRARSRCPAEVVAQARPPSPADLPRETGSHLALGCADRPADAAAHQADRLGLGRRFMARSPVGGADRGEPGVDGGGLRRLSEVRHVQRDWSRGCGQARRGRGLSAQEVN